MHMFNYPLKVYCFIPRQNSGPVTCTDCPPVYQGCQLLSDMLWCLKPATNESLIFESSNKWCLQSHFRVNLLLCLFLALPTDFVTFLCSVDSTLSRVRNSSLGFDIFNVASYMNMLHLTCKKWETEIPSCIWVHEISTMKIATTA